MRFALDIPPDVDFANSHGDESVKQKIGKLKTVHYLLYVVISENALVFGPLMELMPQGTFSNKLRLWTSEQVGLVMSSSVGVLFIENHELHD